MYIYKNEHNHQQTDDWLWDTILNNLSLGLKPIGAISKTHLWLVVVELLHRNGFSEWVSQVLLSVDLLKIDVTSIHFSDEMVVVQNMLRPLVCLWFLRLSNGSRAVTVEQNWTNKGGCYSELDDEFSQPHHFFGSIWCSNILCLTNWISHCVLLETLPADSSTIKGKNKSWHTLAVIMIRLKTKVCNPISLKSDSP